MTPNEKLVLAIARVAHEVNRAYCQSLGDSSQLPWEDCPHWQKESAIAGVKAHLADPNMSPSAAHEAWKKHKLADGWTYGPVKDPVKKEHPCMVPYCDLPAEQRAKDFIFKGVVTAIAREQARKD